MGKSKKASVVKLGIVYTLSNLIVKGMAFLTTPIFTRILSKSDYGSFSNISSWTSIIIIIVTMQLQISIARAKYDYNDDIDNYLASILVLGNIITAIWYAIFEINISWFEQFLGFDRVYIRIIFLYAFFSPAMQLLLYKSRMYSNWQQVIFLTWITLLVSTIGSVVTVFLFENKLFGRTVGAYFLITIIDIGLWIFVLLKGKSIRINYWKYSLKFSVPLLPHELAGTILVISDRIIINRLCGAEDAALYSLAYTVSTIATVLLSSLNQAVQPWLYDHINGKKYEEIYELIIPYTICFGLGNTLISLLGPEVVFLFGGEAYKQAIYVIPPVCYGIMIQFVYTLYANIEFYEKKTGWVSLATIIAGAVNMGLNFLLIPKFGYISASYTTVIGFVVMLILHFVVVKYKTNFGNMYNNIYLFAIIIFMLMVMFLSLVLYNYTILRYFTIGLLIVAVFVYILKNKRKLLSLIIGETH